MYWTLDVNDEPERQISVHTDNKVVLYCIALYCIALHCIVLLCISLYWIALYCVVLHCIVFCCVVLHCIVLHCIAMYCIALYCIAMHCIVLHCINPPEGVWLPNWRGTNTKRNTYAQFLSRTLRNALFCHCTAAYIHTHRLTSRMFSWGTLQQQPPLHRRLQQRAAGYWGWFSSPGLTRICPEILFTLKYTQAKRPFRSWKRLAGVFCHLILLLNVKSTVSWKVSRF